MKKAVLLAPYFLPRRRVGAWRPFKFAIHLKKYGWQPHIITIHESQDSLTTKEKRVLSDISVYEIKSPFDFTHRLNNGFAYNAFSSNNENKIKKISKKSPAKLLLNWIDKQFPIDSWLPLFLLRKRYIEGVIKKIDPDVLWSTGDPWSSHWLGSKLAGTFNIPWVADFRDPWTLGDVNLKNRSEFSFNVDRQEEAKVLKKASTVVFNARSTQQLYENAYEHLQQKSDTIYNAFDSSLFNSRSAPVDVFDNEKLNIVFFGKFRPLSPATPFIELLASLHQSNPQAAQKVQMYSFGKLSTNEEALARQKGVFENFVTLPHIPLEEALPILSRADVLWLSTHLRRKYIIPAKLWDYLAAKRPVLSVAPNPEIKDILKRTGAGIQMDINDLSAIIDILKGCIRAKQNAEPMPIPVTFDNDCIKQYDAIYATKQLADIFDHLT